MHSDSYILFLIKLDTVTLMTISLCTNLQIGKLGILLRHLQTCSVQNLCKS